MTPFHCFLFIIFTFIYLSDYHQWIAGSETRDTAALETDAASFEQPTLQGEQVEKYFGFLLNKYCKWQMTNFVVFCRTTDSSRWKSWQLRDVKISVVNHEEKKTHAQNCCTINCFPRVLQKRLLRVTIVIPTTCSRKLVIPYFSFSQWWLCDFLFFIFTK